MLVSYGGAIAGGPKDPRGTIELVIASTFRVRRF